MPNKYKIIKTKFSKKPKKRGRGNPNAKNNKGNNGANKGRSFLTKKDAWLHYFLDKENKKTFFNRTESAIAAGYNGRSRGSYGAMGSMLFKRFKSKINKWLDEGKIIISNRYVCSEEALKGKLISLIAAKEKKFFSKDGIVVTTKTVEALEIQRKSLDMAYKARAMYQPKRIEISTKKEKKKKKKLKRMSRGALESLIQILEK